ncbi:MAG: hypothetical protein AAF571_14530 [Verrucomicrobiota bacterium]
MSRWKSFRRTQTILTIFLAAMFLVGMAALTNPKGNYEWFPFYSWSMFGLVPQEEAIYRLMIEDAGPGSQFDYKLIDFRMAGDQVNEPDSLAAYHLIQKIGKAVTAGQSDEIAKLRAAFDASYLKAGTIYFIFESREDPLSAWTDPLSYSDAKFIGQFMAGEDLP